MTPTTTPTHFIKNIIIDDLEHHRCPGGIVTRFPPEPNGYLHIGHAKSICLNFGLAEEFHGRCNLRFDDTNPAKESVEYVESIKQDVRWLGYQWQEPVRFASDYFEALYQYAIELIQKGLAFVCDLSPEQIREYRGTLTEPGRNSPFRDRSIDENLDLFRRMRAGEFADGSRVLRARIDMASPNLNMRDPVLYRIMHTPHHQTGDQWPIYPMYDYAHCISDALEGITHSLCTLEFEDHRPLYDWILDHISVPCHPRQIEFARLNLEYTVVSKRKLHLLVSKGYVDGWDDPRMPTLAGLRRRGYTPASIRSFTQRIGVTKVDTTIELGVLEGCVREDLEEQAPRAMAVLDPLKVIITNYPPEREEILEAPKHPKRSELGTRKLPFCRELYIDRSDFNDNPPRKYKRLTPGGEVRLRNAYVIKCEEAVTDPETGVLTTLHCTYDPDTLGKNPEGRKVKGVIHWVSARHALRAQVRLYDRLFNKPNPDEKREGEDFEACINPHSLIVREPCFLEPGLADATREDRFQFEREGYFCLDPDSTPERPVFNRIVTLRDSWAKIEQQQSGPR